MQPSGVRRQGIDPQVSTFLGVIFLLHREHLCVLVPTSSDTAPFPASWNGEVIAGYRCAIELEKEVV